MSTGATELQVLERKLDLLAGEVRALTDNARSDTRRRESWEELRADLARLAVEACPRIAERLEDSDIDAARPVGVSHLLVICNALERLECNRPRRRMPKGRSGGKCRLGTGPLRAAGGRAGDHAAAIDIRAPGETVT